MRRRRLALLLLALTAPLLTARGADRAAQKAWADAQSSFSRAMKSDDPAVRLAAVREIGLHGTVECAKLLVEDVLAKEASGRVLDAAVTALARHADDEAVAWLASASAKGKWNIRAMILEALASRVDPSPSYAAFLRAADDRDPRIRTMALFGLGGSKNAEALPVLVAALEAKEWQVRVAAIEGLRDLKNADAVKPLILRLQEETGRLRGDIGDALEDLTGQKFGTDAADWLRWLEAKEKGEELPAAEQPERPAPAGRVVGEPAGRETAAAEPTYYGIKLISEKIVFVIDLSLSMKDPIEIDRRKLIGETRVRTPGAGEDEPEAREGERFEDGLKWWKIKCGLDLAKAQLVFALGQLDRKQSFDIVTFSDEAEAWQGRLIKATPMARAKAANFIEGLDVIGATNSYAALDLAFELAGKGRGSTPGYATGADTIFFLSDGAPSVGEFIKPEDILREIARRNKTRRIKIHVIGLNVNVPFLRNLAAQNGGDYKRF